MGVVDSGVDVGAVVQEVFGGTALAAVAGLPERVVDLGGFGFGVKELFEAGQQAQCGGKAMPPITILATFVGTVPRSLAG